MFTLEKISKEIEVEYDYNTKLSKFSYGIEKCQFHWL